MIYFQNPEQAVESITTLLLSADWQELSRYYDLSGTHVDKDRLLSGEFFIRENRPEVAHPGGFWRYKQPFSPGFTYQWHQTHSNGIVDVTVGIDIDQGDGMIQRGQKTFQLRQSANGYQLLPDKKHQGASEKPVITQEIKR